jgi:hypothetical protein
MGHKDPLNSSKKQVHNLHSQIYIYKYILEYISLKKQF